MRTGHREREDRKRNKGCIIIIGKLTKRTHVR